MLSYELGATFEPAAAPPVPPAHPLWPGAIVLDCPDALIHDAAAGRWFSVGDLDLRDLRHALHARPEPGLSYELDSDALEPSVADRDAFIRAAARAVELIHAGDIFQANISHRLEGRFAGSARALFADMMRAAAPWYGAYIEWPGNAIVSASPELFFDFDAQSRRIVTRPIKGTRPGDAAPRDLLASPKDEAELNMIIDLMRNDLGRVCEFGSIRVAEARALERHAHALTGRGVLHGVATVEGRLRHGLSVPHVLHAAFPGGSITGAPKVRAMQVIAELERRERGPYTGSIGYISDCGRACFNIAIRTAAIRERAAEPSRAGVFADASLEYGIGAGIVADSDPASEWEETLTKAEVILQLARARTPSVSERP